MIKLNVPYHSQLNNLNNPTGACNVTSMAMVMRYCGFKNPSGGQLEDYLYEWLIRKGWSRHSPYDLARMVEEVSDRQIFCNFSANTTIEQVQNHLRNGWPAVIHGYFTAFGHIIAVVGFDANGFIVHDPYGEYFESGYRTDLSGAFLNYSYDLIRRTCIPDGQFWAHLVSTAEPNPYAPLPEEKKEELSGLRLGDVLDLKLDIEFKIGVEIATSLVKNVQICLGAHLGIDPGPRDGKLGPNTESAYREAMFAHQCRPDRLGEREATLLIQGHLS